MPSFDDHREAFAAHFKDIASFGSHSSRIKNKDMLTGEVFEIIECPTCGLGKTITQPTIDLSKYYDTAYYGNKNIRFNPIVEALIKFFRHRRANIIHQQAGSSKGAILDIGCGRALMLGHLRSYGWEVHGTERSLMASEYARDVLHVNIRVCDSLQEAGYNNNSFQVISLWHVLEHVTHPDQMLDEIYRILDKTGLLVIEVPNVASWQAFMARDHWLYMEAPRHLYHFSPDSITQLLHLKGFRLLSQSTVSLEFGFIGMMQSILNLFMPVKNFLFLVLKNNTSVNQIGIVNYIINSGLLLISIIPVAVIGVFLEIGAMLFSRGGVIRIIARKQ